MLHYLEPPTTQGKMIFGKFNTYELQNALKHAHMLIDLIELSLQEHLFSNDVNRTYLTIFIWRIDACDNV